MPVKIFVALVASIFKALKIKVNITSKDFDVMKTAKGILLIILIMSTVFLIKRISVLTHRIHDTQERVKVLESSCVTTPTSPADPVRQGP